MARRNSHPSTLPKPRPARAEATALPEDDPDVELLAWLGERTRRVALGLLAALITARAYWPSEPDLKAEAGTGLPWDLAIVIVAGLAVVSWLLSGAVRIRWSWTDAALVALFVLVGMSTSQAHDRRVAINLAWDWAAVGLGYFLLRNLPRTAAESRVLVGSLVAVATAVAVYGLYHAGVELPELRAYYLAHKAQVLADRGYAPGSPAAAMFEDRLLHSREPISTFALANSLAGFLVGPLVIMLAVGWENLVRRDAHGSRLAKLALFAPLVIVVLVCLILTKSRSAYVGLAVALTVLAWGERRRVSGRTLAIAGLAGLLVVSGLVAVGLAAGELDRWVLTETTKSLRYRGEYWVGAWRVITESSQLFWRGHGPGNFTAHYLRHKLPQSSEEIFDPHNLVLEVWSTAGAWAMLALLTALGFAFWNSLPRRTAKPAETVEPEMKPSARPGPSDPPRRLGWLLACAGGGWVAASLVGQLNPFQADLLMRWLILGGAWLGAVALGIQLWQRLPVPPWAIGAAALAVTINLLAAGGIGIPGVALMLWSLVALGLNLREDRPCGRVREAGGWVLGLGLALGYAALVGIFVGAITPYWKSEAKIGVAEVALAARPPQFEIAEKAYIAAGHNETGDTYSARPWLGLAYEKMREWETRGSKPEDRRWRAIPIALAEAVAYPRNYRSWALHHERANVTRLLIKQLGDKLKPGELVGYRANVVEASRRASQLYPSNATLHAELAIASAEIGMYADAVKEAGEALRYDGLTPHADKKLPNVLRKRIETDLPSWEKSAQANPINTP